MTRLAAPGLTRRLVDLTVGVHATRGLHGGAGESRYPERT